MRKWVFVFLMFYSMNCVVDAQNRGYNNNVECNSNLYINNIRTGNKNWKVVVDHEFNYSARPTNNLVNWTWEIGEGVCNSPFIYNWKINPTGGSFGSDGKAKIDPSPMPPDNSYFGPVKGLVRVDIVRVDNTTDKSCSKKNGSDAVVEVFFEKDATNNSNGNVPNWFYYWSQIPLIQNLLSSVSGFLLYDRPNCKWQQNPTPVYLALEYVGAIYPYNQNGTSTYGSCYFDIFNMNREDLYSATPPSCITITDPQNLAIVSYGNAQKIEIGEGCGFKKNIDTCNPSAGEIEGIHVFYRTVAHEVEHAKITSEVWSFTHPSRPDVDAGYMLIYDRDRDFYKDIWEELSADGIANGFNPDPNTGGNDKYNENYSNCFCTGNCSKGTQYEETRCRNVENALNINDINAFDWSFDPTKTHQGKQW